MSANLIKTEVKDRVALITLNRPEVLNALNDAMIDELAEAMRAFDADDDVGVMVLTGSEKAFAAGADIAAMKDWSYTDVYKQDYLGHNWEALRRIRKPVIAAVAGYALGEIGRASCREGGERWGRAWRCSARRAGRVTG